MKNRFFLPFKVGLYVLSLPRFACSGQPLYDVTQGWTLIVNYFLFSSKVLSRSSCLSRLSHINRFWKSFIWIQPLPRKSPSTWSISCWKSSFMLRVNCRWNIKFSSFPNSLSSPSYHCCYSVAIGCCVGFLLLQVEYGLVWWVNSNYHWILDRLSNMKSVSSTKHEIEMMLNVKFKFLPDRCSDSARARLQQYRHAKFDKVVEEVLLTS